MYPVILSVFVATVTGEKIGHSVHERPELDTARFWTMVDTTPFTTDGKIYNVDVWVKRSGRPLRIGVYRPTGRECQFDLVQQIEFDSLPLGKNEVMADF